MSETKIDTLTVNEESLIKSSKPLFYGFTFLAGITLLTNTPSYAGTLLGIAVMAAITFVAASLSDSLESDWQNFVNIVAVVTLLSAVLAGAYVATTLSFL